MGMKWVVKVETKGLVEPRLGWEAEEGPGKVCLHLSEGLIPEGRVPFLPPVESSQGSQGVMVL